MIYALIALSIVAYLFVGTGLCYLFHRWGWVAYDKTRRADHNDEAKEFTFFLFALLWPFAIIGYVFLGTLLLIQRPFNKQMKKDESRKDLKDFVKKCQTEKSEKHRNL